MRKLSWIVFFGLMLCPAESPGQLVNPVVQHRNERSEPNTLTAMLMIGVPMMLYSLRRRKSAFQFIAVDEQPTATHPAPASAVVQLDPTVREAKSA